MSHWTRLPNETHVMDKGSLVLVVHPYSSSLCGILWQVKFGDVILGEGRAASIRDAKMSAMKSAMTMDQGRVYPLDRSQKRRNRKGKL